MQERIATDAVALFVAINPVAVVPLFLGVTRGALPAERQRIALRGCLVAAAVLVASIAGGQPLLDALGIAAPSFRMAGGLVLLIISMRMILGEGPAPVEGQATAPGTNGLGRDLAVFPVALPFIAHPGSILTAVVLTDGAALAHKAVTTGVLLLTLAVTHVMLLTSDQIYRVLTNTGTNVLTRVFGLIFAALSVQIILDGIRGSFSLP